MRRKLGFLGMAIGCLIVAYPALGQVLPGTGKAATTCETNVARNCVRIRDQCETQCTIAADPNACDRKCAGDYQVCQSPECR